MTVATLEELMGGPKPKEHRDLALFGWREDKVAGRKRYVGRDAKGRAVVGPVRHGKGVLNWFRKRKQKGLQEMPAPQRALKVVIDHEAVMAEARKAQALNVAKMQEGTKTVDFSKLGENLRSALPPTPPQPKPSRWAKLKDWLLDYFYDEEWQRAMRNTAGNILLWSFTVFAVLVFAKGAWWVLSL